MNFIQLDPASLAIGYVAGTLLCWYVNETLNAKESEYEQEPEGCDQDFCSGFCDGDNHVSIRTPERK